MEALGALLIVLGILLAVLTWTESTGQVIAVIAGAPSA